MSTCFGPKKYLAICNKTNFRCAYCGKELAEDIKLKNGISAKRVTEEAAIDHIFPKSKGGTNNIENLFLCCKHCNAQKGTKTIMEFKFRSTLRKYNIPMFTTEQLLYLSTKVKLSELFPEPEKFYFETLNKENK